MLKTVLGKIPCWVESRQSGVDVYWLSYSLCVSLTQVVMKPSMKRTLDTKPLFLLATKGKRPIVPDDAILAGCSV